VGSSGKSSAYYWSLECIREHLSSISSRRPKFCGSGSIAFVVSIGDRLVRRFIERFLVLRFLVVVGLLERIRFGVFAVGIGLNRIDRGRHVAW
jgi:hypothetical protein